jgi:hypothetical protein
MAAHQEPPNHLQQALAEMASHLPAGTANIAVHTAALKSALLRPMTPKFDSVAEALEHAQAGLMRFLSSPRAGMPTG